ncbi:MAG: (2Fe-2S)-binding protein [Acidobacteriota bacterium]
MADQYRSIRVTVNGQEYCRQVEPRKLLSDFLRDDLELKGTHVGCEHGICGACTVLFNGQTARSCLLFAIQADGAQIKTVEGLATNGELHPVQQGFWDNHGLQCGFCTPGFLLTACELLERNPDPTEEEVRVGLSGNMCRCTGYKQIVDSVMDAAEKIRAQK